LDLFHYYTVWNVTGLKWILEEKAVHV